MRMKWMLTILIFMGVTALSCAAAYGQADAKASKQTPAASRTETDLGLSGFATFTSASSGNGTAQTPSNGYGGMFELRQIVKPLLGYELAVNYGGADQAFAPKAGACELTCQSPPTSITATATEFSIDYVASFKTGNLRPFVVGGLGVFVTIPGPTPQGNNTSIRGAYVAGGGLDWALGPHLGIRLQYRDTFYKAPNISAIYPATGVLTQSGEPMGGVFYRF